MGDEETWDERREGLAYPATHIRYLGASLADKATACSNLLEMVPPGPIAPSLADCSIEVAWWGRACAVCKSWAGSAHRRHAR